MRITFLILTLFSMVTYAQQKARNDDLREIKTSFEIKHSGESYSLKSDNGSFYIEKDSKKKFRVTTTQANESTLEFNSIFLKFKYEIGEEKLKCSDISSMNMLGEDHSFCSNDKKRIKTLQEFIAKLNKYLK